MWHPSHMPFHDHTRVLLQYARILLFYTLVCHSRSGYTHGNYSGYCIRGTIRSQGSAS